MSGKREYFNSIASGWDAASADSTGLEEYLRTFGVAPGERILDIGAGTGRMARRLSVLAGDTGTVIAQDFAMEMLTEGKRLEPHPGIVWICNDCQALSFASGVFDKVVCFSVFPHIADRTAALQEIHRVLKDRGKLLILHMQGSHELNAFHASLDSIVRHDRLPPAGELASLLERTGFHLLTARDEPALYWVEAEKL